MKWKFPISPVAASRPRVSKWGSYYTGTYKEFREQARPIIKEVLKDWKPTEDPLMVYVEVFPTRPRTSKLDHPRPDIDNFVKAIFDLCNGTVWKDDSQIIYMEANKAWAKNDGYFTVEIEEL